MGGFVPGEFLSGDGGSMYTDQKLRWGRLRDGDGRGEDQIRWWMKDECSHWDLRFVTQSKKKTR